MERSAAGGRWTRRLLTTAACSTLVISAMSPVTAAAAKPETGTPVAQLADFELLATHDWAASQPTATGRALVDLEVFEGRIWAGYGDYGANTGPITIASVLPEPGAGFEAETVADSEAIYNLRSVNGKLVAPSTDPRVAADFTVGSPWENVRSFDATHVFDTATLTGSDLWMVGSQGSDAVAWRSLDGGVTWDEAQRVSPQSGVPGDFLRFYFAGVMNGRLYVQASSVVSGPAANSLVFDGSAWSKSSSLLPGDGFGWRPVQFADGLLLHQRGHGKAGQIIFFDGRRARVVAEGFDFAVAAKGVHVLGVDGRVSFSADLGVWADVGSAPATAVSLAVDDGSVVVGTSDAQVWIAALNALPTDEVVDPVPVVDVGSTDGTGDVEHPPARCPKGWIKKGRCG